MRVLRDGQALDGRTPTSVMSNPLADAEVGQGERAQVSEVRAGGGTVVGGADGRVARDDGLRRGVGERLGDAGRRRPRAGDDGVPRRAPRGREELPPSSPVSQFVRHRQGRDRGGRAAQGARIAVGVELPLQRGVAAVVDVNACVAVSPIRCVAVMPPGATVSDGGTPRAA